LVGIDALRPAAKPRTLKLFDDQLESVDLTLVLLDDGRHVAHKAMQQGRVRRKIVEIELLVESYAGALIQSSNFVIFHAGFRILSTRERRLSGALRCAAVKAFDQYRKLRRRQRHGAAGRCARPPASAPSVALCRPAGQQDQCS
jgi:hypothetical protein